MRVDHCRPAIASKIQVSLQPSAEAGGLGWAPRGCNRARASAGSEARQMPAASCRSHAPVPSSALRPTLVPALFFHAEPGWEKGPTPGAPGCPARSNAAARLQLAGVHGRPSSGGGGTSPGDGRAASYLYFRVQITCATSSGDPLCPPGQAMMSH
ncbi:uncharacterized protein PS065_008972 isoform 2-T3 [Dugong dugon]